MAGVVTFSILGHIAQEQGSGVGDVVKSGPGLVFLTYPDVVLKLPGAPFWAATFFIMLVVSEIHLWKKYIFSIILSKKDIKAILYDSHAIKTIEFRNENNICILLPLYFRVIFK